MLALISIFLGIFILKTINAYGIATIIHRFTKINNKIYNLILGFTIQMGFFGFFIIISYLTNLEINKAIYLLIFAQACLILIFIINYKYFFSPLKINSGMFWGFVLVFILTLILTIILIAIFQTINFINIETRSPAVNGNMGLRKLNWTQFYWGYNVLFYSLLQQHSLSDQSYFLYFFENIDFTFLFVLISLYTFKSQVQGLKRLRYLKVSLVTALTWLILFVIHIKSAPSYWYIIFTFIFFIILINSQRYTKRQNAIFFTANCLSCFFFNPDSFYWILIATVFALVYYVKAKSTDLVYFFIISSIPVLMGLVSVFYYKNNQNVPELFYYLIVPFIVWTTFTFGLLYFYSKFINYHFLQSLHRFIQKYTIRVLTTFIVLLTVTSILYLPFNNWQELLLIVSKWTNWTNHEQSINSFFSIFLWVIYILILLFYLARVFVYKKLKNPIHIANGYTILVVTNPIFFLFYLIATNNGHLNNNVYEDGFPFLLFALINMILSFLLTDNNLNWKKINWKRNFWRKKDAQHNLH